MAMTWRGPHDVRAGRLLDPGMDITPGSIGADTSTMLGRLGLGIETTMDSRQAWSRKKPRNSVGEVPLMGPAAKPDILNKIGAIASGTTASTDGLSGMSGRGETAIGDGKTAFGVNDLTPSVGNMAWGGSGMSAW